MFGKKLTTLQKLILLYGVKGAAEILRTVSGPAPLVLENAIARAMLSLTQTGKVEQRNLPHGYTELEYIESDGDQYIDLDTTLNQDDEIEIEFEITANQNAISIFGYRAGASSNNIMLFFGGTTNRVFIDFNNSDYTDYRLSYDVSANTRYKAIISKTRRAILAADGTTLAENTTPCPDTITCPRAFLFAASGSPASNNRAACKVYSCVINGKRNIVGAKDSANVVEMYDKVSAAPFTNAGTGSFAAGPVLTPSPERPMDLWCNNGVLKFKDAELPVGYKRLKDVIFDGDVYYVTDTYLTGADTTTCTINATESARNVLGCYTGLGDGNNNLFYLVVAGSGNYVRYKGNLYRPMLNDGALGQDRTLSITPTGTTGFDTNATWTELEFTCPDKFYIGWLANATSPKFLGTFKGNVTVSNRAKFIPCERESDNEIGYYDVNSSTFFENQGTGTPATSGYDDTHNIICAVGTPEVLTVSADGAETQTVNDVPMLLSVGEDKDEGEIIEGLLTHKVGIKVLDGTETGWTQATTTGGVLRFYLPFDGAGTPTGAREQVASTHFVYAAEGQDLGIAFLSSQTRVYFIPDDQTMTDTTWKAWLAAQYAAGTPVIVVYPLATETTEQTTAHEITLAEGTNIVTVQAEVDGVELAAVYKGKKA